MSRRKSNRVARRLLGMRHWRTNAIKYYAFQVRPAFGWVIAWNRNRVRSLKRAAQRRDDMQARRAWLTYFRCRQTEIQNRGRDGEKH